MFKYSVEHYRYVRQFCTEFTDKFSRTVLAAFFAVSSSCLNFTYAANLDESIAVNIPSQKLSDALIELGSQSEISIVFPSSLPLNTCCVELKGDYTPRQALEFLLKDQAIQWQAFNSRVVALSAKATVIEPKPAFQPAQFSEIVVLGEQVTGSRIKRLDLEGSAPVDIITDSEISSRGVQAVSDYLKFIPAVSGNSTSTAVSNGGDGTATITLRGLPSANTLVLLNGRRTANSGFAGDSVDLNSIPLVSVERIEVLKDGASAIYGSDAIAGVVNIILKQEFEGFLIDQYYGQTSRGDLGTTHTSLVGGFATENANYMLSASHFDQKPIYSRDRELSENADGRNQGGADLRSSSTPFTRITLPNDLADPADDQVVILDNEFADPNLVSSYRPATDEDLYNYRETTSSVSPTTRSSVFYSTVHHLSDFTQLVSHGGYTETETQVSLAPFPLLTITEDPAIVTSAANPYNPFGVDIYDVRRRVTELGPRYQNTAEKSYRFNLVLENLYQDFNWDIAFNWNLTEANETDTGELDYDLIRLALSEDCSTTADCIPLNVFGPPGSIDQTQLEYLETVTKYEGLSKLYEITANADTEIESLLADPISIAGGFSSRRERSKLEPLTDVGNARPSTTNGQRTVFETYLETNLPIINRKPFAYSLELELATRYSRYSDFGKSNNPKIGIRYRPVQDALIRSTISRGFRAPSLNQLNVSNKQSLDLLDDPCAMATNVGLLPGCVIQADPSLLQFIVTTGGNKNLTPETSLSRTLGFVWTPTQLPNLYFSMDWFWIRQEDIIDSRPQFIVEQNAKFGLFADQVIRDDQGNILRIEADYLNVGSLNVRGLDLTLRYQFLHTQSGNYTFSLNGSRIDDYLQKLSPITPSVDLSGTFADQASAGAGAIPQLKLNTGLNWSNENWEVNYNVFYVDELEENLPYTNLKRKINSWTTHNFQSNYLAGQRKNFRITVGIDNIFDRAPPFAASAFNDNHDPRTYEIKGRSWYGQVRYQF